MHVLSGPGQPGGSPWPKPQRMLQQCGWSTAERKGSAEVQTLRQSEWTGPPTGWGVDDQRGPREPSAALGSRRTHLWLLFLLLAHKELKGSCCRSIIMSLAKTGLWARLPVSAQYRTCPGQNQTRALAWPARSYQPCLPSCG